MLGPIRSSAVCVAHGITLFSASRCSLKSAFVALRISRISSHKPPLSPLRDDVALPASVLGPVDLSHGFQRLIASACFALRSGVHPLAMLMLQKFGLI